MSEFSHLLQSATATGAGTAVSGLPASRSYSAIVSGTGAVSATIDIEVSNDGTNYIVLGTISLAGTTSAKDGFSSLAPWKHTRANVTAISGTSAAVSVQVGY